MLETRLKHRTALLGIVSAVLALVTAGLGTITAVTARQKNDAQAQTQDLQRDVDATKQRIADLNRQLDEAREQLAKAQAGDGLPSPGPSTTTAANVVNQGNLTLAGGYCANLDSTAANWGVDGCGPGGGWDLKFDGSYLDRYYNGTEYAVLNSGASETLQTCESQTRLQTSIPGRDLKAGLRFCAHTTEENYSLVRVDQVSRLGKDDATLALTVITWDA